MKKIIYLMFSLLLLFSCDNQQLEESNLEGGSLLIDINSEVSRTLTPEISMEIDSYEIIATGPNPATDEIKESISINKPTLAKKGLAVGHWSIRVNAKNTAGKVIAKAYSPFTIENRKETNLRLTVEPILNEVGTFLVDVSWPATVINPVIEAEIYDGPSGRPLDPPPVFKIENNKVTCNSNEIWAGYYTLEIQLFSGTDTEPLWGKAVSFRIIAGETTSYTEVLTEAQTDKPGILVPAGTGAITITEKLNNPAVISFTGNKATITTLESMNITAAVTGADNNTSFTYKWFLNGDELTGETSSNITLKGLTVGNYWLDVLAENGSTISSGTIQFTVTN